MPNFTDIENESEPVPEDELDPDELEFIESSGTARRFVDEKTGKAYWVQDVPVYGPTSNTSFERTPDGVLIEIPVLSLPTPTFIGHDANGKPFYAPKSGWTVTDIDKGKKPKIPPLTYGMVRTERGWQVMQRGDRRELDKLNDEDYKRISRERGHWNQRVLSRDQSKQRVLNVRLADYESKQEVRDLVNTWKASGGTAKGFRGFWSSWRLGTGKEL